MNKLIEDIAMILHLHEGGVDSPEEYLELFEEEQLPFTDIEEWEKDDLRLQAQKIIDMLIDKGIKGLE